MASTDTRSGFRLPWSSDRSHDEGSDELATEPTQDAEANGAQPDDSELPETDLRARLSIGDSEPRSDNDPRPPELGADSGPSAEEPPLMVDINPAPSAPAATPRKPSKLMADLSAAIRATAETAREQALSQTDTTARQVVETIREQSTEGATDLRRQSDEDIAGIRDWSKAEIARIREETDRKITTRKATLEDELSEHAASVDRQVGDVHAEVAQFQANMDAYLERLRSEDDPARLATLAESMPDSPTFEAWIGRSEEQDEASPEVEATNDAEAETEAGDDADPTAETAIEPAEATTELEAEAVTGSVETAGEAVDGEPVDGEPVDGDVAVGDAAAEPGADEDGSAAADEPVGVIEVDPGTGDAEASEAMASAEPDAVDPGVAGDADPEPAESSGSAWGSAWGDAAGDWTTPTPPKAEDDPSDDGADGTPRWAAGELPDGFPTASETGEPVDRGAIMAALEAAAEAVVAAESAADSADQAEVAAGVAETAAELFRGHPDADETGEAMSALDARVEAGGFDAESFTGRLASLLPGHGGGADGEPQTSQVIVSGLVSVASIASFKRHLGRIAGVQSVTVASGPEGEFVFNVNHRPDVMFRDVIPTMQGFAARVTGSEDGVVHVTARDPEAEA